MIGQLATMDYLRAEWARCEHWLAPAIAECRGTHTVEDVRGMVMVGDAIFWPGRNAAAVTEIIFHPRMRQHHFWLCGGDMREIVNEMLPVAEAWGKSIGCTRFSTAGRVNRAGRDGWERVLRSRGYAPAWSICIKDAG